MYRIITVEREYGSGAGDIARELADRLGWKLWDNAITDEIAKLANVDTATVKRCDERVSSTFHRLAKVFWRGSYERSIETTTFDPDDMVPLVQQVLHDAVAKGSCVIVGRGAPYFLRERSDAFHVFLYASRTEKLRRLQATGMTVKEAEEQLDSVDRDRIEFVKRYFGADWPTRCLYHLMVNTAIGNEAATSLILNSIRLLDARRSEILASR